MASAPVSPCLSEDGPQLFPGLVSSWPAYKLWKGEEGVQRLTELAGGVQVQVMVARGREFVGDMQHLLLLSAQLADFLSGRLEARLPVVPARPGGGPPPEAPHLYLAQQPLSAARAPGQALEPGALHALGADLRTPALLEGRPLSAVNLWASRTRTRSSTHYDPYANLLCLVAGAKTVRLLPPSAAPWLRPQALHHESSNHSPVSLAELAEQRGPQPRLRSGEERPPVVAFTLQAGDALSIPEGWWHQVDSAAGTLAVNFWWPTPVALALGGQSDRYYFRRALQSLVEAEKGRLLEALAARPLELPPPATTPSAGREDGGPAPEAKRPRREEGAAPSEHYYLQAAGVGLVERVALSEGEAGLLEALLRMLDRVQAQGEVRGPQPAMLHSGVERVLAAAVGLGRDPLMRVLLELRERTPAGTAVLLLECLSPAAWELLCSRLEAHEAELAAAEGVPEASDLFASFYARLYSAVPDRQALLAVILAQKLAFAEGALRAVLARELGGQELPTP